jgi:hypothetical protein
VGHSREPYTAHARYGSIRGPEGHQEIWKDLEETDGRGSPMITGEMFEVFELSPNSHSDVDAAFVSMLEA